LFVSSGIKEYNSEMSKIHLFSAPHLSTPCCLAEPIATYSLDDLPAGQYKLYEQAKKVIEHIKRNVTKVRPAGSMNEVG
jgi:polo-like kinase 4